MAKKWNGWVEKHRLSGGGQGTTYLVTHSTGTHEGEHVLKEIKRRGDPRVKKEVEALSRLNHPNVVHLTDWRIDGDDAWIVTEFCKGGNLTHGDVSDLPIADRFLIFATICSAVASAHQKGVVHRDIKHQNIFFRESVFDVAVGDFGLAFLEGDEDGRVTQMREQVGSRYYIPPELELGKREEGGAPSRRVPA